MSTPNQEYRIEPRPVELGGGWRLHLLEDGEEVGGGVFPASNDEESQAAAYDDALATASSWLAS
jgi:hypothetical protein